MAGGYDKLAKRLGVNTDLVIDWTQGKQNPSTRALDMIANLTRKSTLSLARTTMLTRRDRSSRA
jgi:DNA-binding transcriptional regulator YiaG